MYGVKLFIKMATTITKSKCQAAPLSIWSSSSFGKKTCKHGESLHHKSSSEKILAYKFTKCCVAYPSEIFSQFFKRIKLYLLLALTFRNSRLSIAAWLQHYKGREQYLHVITILTKVTCAHTILPLIPHPEYSAASLK